jgi:hypothetical protein
MILQSALRWMRGRICIFVIASAGITEKNRANAPQSKKIPP